MVTICEKGDTGANVGDAHHAADTTPTSDEEYAARQISSLENPAPTRFAMADDESWYNMVMAMTAVEQHLLDLVNNTDEMQGPESWLDAYVGLAEMQNSFGGAPATASAAHPRTLWRRTKDATASAAHPQLPQWRRT